MIKYVNFIFISLVLFSLTGCIPPAKVDKYIEIKPNETAFVVPLEGDTSSQAKMMSIDYLEKMKVAAKRIYIPQRKVSTGRWWWEIKWIPTVRVITVDRTPITYKWIGDKAIRAESSDSIAFRVGTTISAYIDEKDTARYLYYYPEKDLGVVLQNEIYAKCVEILSKKFAAKELVDVRKEKGNIINEAKSELKDYFKQKGVTITAFGLDGGLKYDDKEIQLAINKNFTSELEIKNEENRKKAQDKINERLLAKAKNDTEVALEFKKAEEARRALMEFEIKKIEAEAKKIMANSWDGRMPEKIIPSNSNMLMMLQ